MSTTPGTRGPVSALLVCAPLTDERAWTPVIDRLVRGQVDVAVVPWPRGPQPDSVTGVESAVAAGATYDVVLGARDGVAGAVHLARHGRARRVVLVGPSGGPALTEVDVDLDVELDATMAGFPPDVMERAVAALQSRDAATFARLTADLMSAQLDPRQRGTVEAMVLEHAATLGEGTSWIPAYHPWADWLPELTVPVVLVLGEQASVPGSYAQRAADALLRRCADGREVVLPFVDAAYAGLSHPAELAEIIGGAGKRG